MTDDTKKALLDREAAFWDRQEEVIGKLHERPHDWRFCTEIADRINRPKLDFIVRAISPYFDEVGSILDIGCGNGWLCHFVADFKVKAYGVDLSSKKIETARQIAAERGIEKYCDFQAADVLEVDLPEKVDVLMAQGSLHHFPNLEQDLPRMVEKFLRPGGLMIFIEPHHEGMSPGMTNFLVRLAKTPIIGKTFDIEFYDEVNSGKQGSGESGTVDDIRGESPAGLEFLGEEPDMGELLKERYELVEERYFHYLSGHLSNAFFTYQKSGFVKRLWRIVLPLVVWMDNRCCRKAKYSKWAEEGGWFLRSPGESNSQD